jgi:hypothetical protein
MLEPGTHDYFRKYEKNTSIIVKIILTCTALTTLLSGNTAFSAVRFHHNFMLNSSFTANDPFNQRLDRAPGGYLPLAGCTAHSILVGAPTFERSFNSS